MFEIRKICISFWFFWVLPLQSCSKMSISLYNLIIYYINFTFSRVLCWECTLNIFVQCSSFSGDALFCYKCHSTDINSRCRYGKRKYLSSIKESCYGKSPQCYSYATGKKDYSNRKDLKFITLIRYLSFSRKNFHVRNVLSSSEDCISTISPFSNFPHFTFFNLYTFCLSISHFLWLSDSAKSDVSTVQRSESLLSK